MRDRWKDRGIGAIVGASFGALSTAIAFTVAGRGPVQPVIDHDPSNANGATSSEVATLPICIFPSVEALTPTEIPSVTATNTATLTVTPSATLDPFLRPTSIWCGPTNAVTPQTPTILPPNPGTTPTRTEAPDPNPTPMPTNEDAPIPTIPPEPQPTVDVEPTPIP